MHKTIITIFRPIALTIVFLSGAFCGTMPEAGPLFVQVHFTSEVRSITIQQLDEILSGKITNFKKLGGPDRGLDLFCDEAVYGLLVKKYPARTMGKASFQNDRHLRGSRSFLGISDSRGLAPCFKTVYIDNRLPWGEIRNDYTLVQAKEYPFVMTGAERWEPDKEITVVQTGVTAMTRAFIRAVKKHGTAFPVSETKDITAGADIAMTSNEVSFLEPCSYPLKDRMRFCSPKDYFKILVDSGFDVIELTGNHNNDYGTRYNTETIIMIEQAGMVYFGGGKNADDAAAVRSRSVRGQIFTFIGFNEIGPPEAWATKNGPGAARLNRNAFERNISESVSMGAITFVYVQWCNENDFTRPWKQQVDYFHRAADLGADIMVSSSAHKAMGIEFYRGKFISYGLGNFLFDQMQSIHHRRGLIARHHFYKGRHIETELIPCMVHDYCRPVLLHGKEARALLDHVFRFSRGEVFR